MFYWDESWTGVRYSSSPPNMYFRLLKVFLYERSVFMLKIDNERLTDKTTILWENESGIVVRRLWRLRPGHNRRFRV